jgi:hypothetical protein
MMKEVKALLENKQRIDLLSPVKSTIKLVLQKDQYHFPFQRRNSMV